MLSSEERTTELASLMGGMYVMGSASHWRKNERASGRDIFLDSHADVPPSREWREKRRKAAQRYIHTAVQRNVPAVEEFSPENLQLVPIEKKMKKETYAAFKAASTSLGSHTSNPCSPSPGDLTEFEWETLLQSSNRCPSRQEALVGLLRGIQKADPTTKVIVFAEEGPAYEAAFAVLDREKLPLIHMELDSGAERVYEFGQPDLTEQDRERPRVALLRFEHAAGHNFQRVSHNVIMYAPLWLDEDGVGAAAKEQQAIGRVNRPGQTKTVFVHRIMLQGPKGEKTIDHSLVERNTDKERIAKATSG
jgi:hypothetical protein